MLPRVVFLNGPPDVGKDFLGQHLIDKLGYCKLKMTRPMDAALQALLGFDDAAYQTYREDLKDVPQEIFRGYTFRELLIDFSEDYCKPRFGEDFFGHRGADFVCSDSELRYVITDSGFSPEAQAIVDRVGAEHCLLIRLLADGCDFKADSRGYLSDLGCDEIEFTNKKTDKSIQDFLNLFQDLEKTYPTGRLNLITHQPPRRG